MKYHLLQCIDVIGLYILDIISPIHHLPFTHRWNSNMRVTIFLPKESFIFPFFSFLFSSFFSAKKKNGFQFQSYSNPSTDPIRLRQLKSDTLSLDDWIHSFFFLEWIDSVPQHIDFQRISFTFVTPLYYV